MNLCCLPGVCGDGSMPDLALFNWVFVMPAGKREAICPFRSSSFYACPGCSALPDGRASAFWRFLASFISSTEENPPATAGGTDTSSPLHPCNLIPFHFREFRITARYYFDKVRDVRQTVF
jgi:hypothetical protein